ncbi:uncharacterized protein LOC123005177 [Tribolium madens]|uniref:uncharacterized protein LOC123005177 n=1 Tax=Tribolium madens TaxID=41895 RepID=UPI001CF71DB9|nr:uncharacterized protein LOC123005177 [Tribolium madens]
MSNRAYDQLVLPYTIRGYFLTAPAVSNPMEGHADKHFFTFHKHTKLHKWWRNVCKIEDCPCKKESDMSKKLGDSNAFAWDAKIAARVVDNIKFAINISHFSPQEFYVACILTFLFKWSCLKDLQME